MGSGDINKTAAQRSAEVPSIVKLPPVPDKMRSNQYNSISDRELIETEIIKNLISSYFGNLIIIIIIIIFFLNQFYKIMDLKI